jgi:hypothetical protein
MLIKLLIKIPGRSANNNFITELQKTEGIQKVYEE